MKRRKRWPFLLAGSAIAIVAFLIALLSGITSPYPDVSQPPAEANRVRHPLGFSIVKPGRTRADIRDASSWGNDQISILPDGGRSRYTPGLYVHRLHEPPDQAKLQRDSFRPGLFQGKDALIYKGPSGEYDAYRVMTDRDGVWYEISLIIPTGDIPAGSIPTPEWQRYLETFAAAK